MQGQGSKHFAKSVAGNAIFQSSLAKWPLSWKAPSVHFFLSLPFFCTTPLFFSRHPRFRAERAFKEAIALGMPISEASFMITSSNANQVTLCALLVLLFTNSIMLFHCRLSGHILAFCLISQMMCDQILCCCPRYKHRPSSSPRVDPRF